MSDIRIEREQGVRSITLTRPEKRNALTREMFTVLTEAFAEEPSNTERLTVLQAEGPAFCAGVDLGQRADNESREGRSPLELLCAAISAYPLPVVAAIQGPAIGGGFMVALHADFAVAGSGVRMGNGAVQLGLAPPWAMTRRVLARCGPALAKELLLLGEMASAERLAQAGAITATVPLDDLQSAVGQLVGRLAANAPLSLRAVKATLEARDRLPAAHHYARALVEKAQNSEDAREGAAARRERREPRFEGR